MPGSSFMTARFILRISALVYVGQLSSKFSKFLGQLPITVFFGFVFTESGSRFFAGSGSRLQLNPDPDKMYVQSENL
jgi:hypothetical protein